MKEIFELQGKLNTHTLARMGLDYETTLHDPDLISVWIENYRKAFSAELAELLREVSEHGIGSPNGKVEIIDMLHFLVSLSQFVQISPEEAAGTTGADHASIADCALAMFLALDDLQNSIKWKWWAKGGGYKPEKAAEAVRELWKGFNAFRTLFGMDFDTMKSVYVAKNRVNHQRLEQGYNEDLKTEADNLSIKD